MSENRKEESCEGNLKGLSTSNILVVSVAARNLLEQDQVRILEDL